MIAVKDLDSLSEIDLDDPIVTSHLWNKSIETITPEEVVAFMKVSAMKGVGFSGTKSVERLLTGVRKLIAAGEIESAKVESLHLPIRKFNIHSLYNELSEFSIAKRHAIIVSILSNKSLDEIVTLKRKDVSQSNLDEDSRFIISQLPISIKSRYVFWEYRDKKLVHLFDLPEHYKSISRFDLQFYRDNLEIGTELMNVEDYWLFRRAFWKDFMKQF